MNRFRGARPRGTFQGSAGRRQSRGALPAMPGPGLPPLTVVAIASVVLSAAGGPAGAGGSPIRPRTDSHPVPAAVAASAAATPAVHTFHVPLSPDSLRALATLDSLAYLAEDRFVGIRGPLGGTLFRVGRLYRAEVMRNRYQLDVGLYDFRLRPVDADGGASLYLVFPNNKLLRQPLSPVSPTMRGHYVRTLDPKESDLFDRYGRANGILHAEIGSRVENARFKWRRESVK